MHRNGTTATTRSLARIAMALCALFATCGIALATATQAYAAEAKYIGEIDTWVSFADDGYPEYDANGNLKYNTVVTLYDIEGVSGVYQLPETFDVTVTNEDGTTAEVISDVTPDYVVLSFQYRSSDDGSSMYGWKNTGLTGLDFTQCTNLKGVRDYGATTVKTLDVHSLANLREITLSTCDMLESVNTSGCSSLRELYLYAGTPASLVDLTDSQWLGLTKLIMEGEGAGAITPLTLPNLTVLNTYGNADVDLQSEWPNLEHLYLSNFSREATLNASAFPKLNSLGIDYCSEVSVEGTWDGLESLSAYRVSSFVEFDGSQFPNLTSVNFEETGLTSFDASACTNLEYVGINHNAGLTSLDVNAIPNSVKSLSCTYCNIAETDALVERFGAMNVLPQMGDSDSSEARFCFFTEYDASGSWLVGQEVSYSTGGCFEPSSEDWNNWNAEDETQRNSSANYTISSSDETVLKAEVLSASDANAEYGDEDPYGAIRLTAVGAGTTQLTISYEFVGEYGTYELTQVVDFTIVDTRNHVTEISASQTAVNVPFISECAYCGESHGDWTEVPITVALEDSTRPVTNDVSFNCAIEDESIAGCYLDTDSMELTIYPYAAGKTTITLSVDQWTEDGSQIESVQPVQIEVTVAEPKLTLASASEVRIAVNESHPSGSEGLLVGSEDMVAMQASGYTFLFWYEDDDDYQLIDSNHGYNYFLQYGDFQYGEGTEKVFWATSSNTEVATIDEVDPIQNWYPSAYAVTPHKAGQTTVTFGDIWGNEKTCTVTVVDIEEEANKLSLSSDEVTLNVGEDFDLATLIRGIDELDSGISREALLLARTSNGAVAPIDLSDVDSGMTALEAKVYGRSVGTAAVTLYMRTDSMSYLPLEVPEEYLALIGTVTVNVVDPSEPSEPNLATGVEVTGDSDQIEVGSTLQLTATITPSDAENAGDLAWSTSDANVAEVGATGLVTAKKPGTAVITAKVGDVSGTYTVTVIEKKIPATGITLSDANTDMVVGGTQNLSATVAPADSTDQVKWDSSDESVLTVDQSGCVTAVGNGTATITATAGSQSATTSAITVTTPVSGVTLDATTLQLVKGGEASTLTATVEPGTASDKGVAWSTSNASVATVDQQGVVAPVGAGTATITVTTNDGGHTATCTVTVLQPAEGISLDKTDATIVGADAVQIAATVNPADAYNKNVTWTSSNEAVATVDANGNVTAVSKGTATITATAQDGGFQASCTVTVSNPVTSIAVEPTQASLIKGETTQLNTTLSGALGGETDGATIAWTSSNEAVATVDANGKVTAVATGNATITASAGEGLLATCTVAVSNPVQSVAVSETQKTITLGGGDSLTFTLTATVTPADADDTKVVWSSSDSNVAEVDQNGNVTVKAAGSATITASVGGKSATCTVTVNPLVVPVASENGFTATVEVSDAAAAEEVAAAVDEGLTLVVQPTTEVTPAAQETLDQMADGDTTVALVFDAMFINDEGAEVKLNDSGRLSITVRIPMTDEMKALDPNTLQVFYLADDGSIEKMPTWVDGDVLCFETTHFSTYVVTGSEPQDPQDPQQKPQQPIGLDTGSDSDDQGLASTGDAVAPLVTAAMACAALSGLAVAIARRRAR